MVPALKALLVLLDSMSSMPAPVGSSSHPQVREGVHKEAFFCGISPLGAHLDEEVKAKIWQSLLIDIWSIISVDLHAVDKDCMLVCSPGSSSRPA